MINILIVEDQVMLRDLLEHVIDEQDDMKVAGITDDAAKAPELCRRIKPDMVLMDVMTANESNGIAFAAKIRCEFPDIKIVIMTALPEITFINEAKKAGAHSYIDKNIGNEHLLHVIRNTMKGFSIYSSNSERPLFAAQLVEKEIAVIRLVCQGLTRDDIAKKLAVSESSVKQYITSILDKTGFDSISRFAIYAAGQGLIVPFNQK